MAAEPIHTLNERYAVLGLLGKGGMGAVYRAQDRALNRLVALKERTPDPTRSAPLTQQAREQFRREAQALAQLAHPGLPRIYDYFSFQENEYIVMELVEGPNLSEFVQTRGPLPEALVLQWARHILDALVYLHARNILHRDIKPNNLILTPDDRIVLVDFGLSKLFDPDSQNTSTTLRGVGTPEYAPLEQYAREVGRTDPRTDVYALGATLYRLLAARPPIDVHTRLLNPDALRPLRELNPSVTFNTEAAIEKAMALYPQARYQTALDLQQALGLTGLSRLERTVDYRTIPTLSAPAVAPAPPETTPSRSMLARNLPAVPTVESVPNEPAPPSGAAARAAPETAPMPAASAAETPAPAAVIEPVEPESEPELTQTFDSPTRRLARSPRFTLKIVRGALYLPLTVGITMEFVRVNAGKFWMGSAPHRDSAAQADELPQREVELGEYWIGKYAVSVAHYTVFTSSTGRQPSFDFPSKSRFPIVNVSWFDAAIFCQWVSEQSGKTVRLPTEAEWEKAARGTDGRVFPWGDEYDPQKLNAAEGGRAGTTPIDQFPSSASPYGAVDLVGNVWEWNSDWYDPNYYAHAPSVDPQGPETGHYKALRGGAWFSDRAHVRAADRTNFNPENHYDYVGFRCVVLPG